MGIFAAKVCVSQSTETPWLSTSSCSPPRDIHHKKRRARALLYGVRAERRWKACSWCCVNTGYSNAGCSFKRRVVSKAMQCSAACQEEGRQLGGLRFVNVTVFRLGFVNLSVVSHAGS